MGSIGPLEILVVLVVALVVLGPNRLPDAARSVGKAVAELRRMSSGLQSEVREAFSEAPPSYPKPAPPAAEPPVAALPQRPEDADMTERLGAAAVTTEAAPADPPPPPITPPLTDTVLADGTAPDHGVAGDATTPSGPSSN